MSSVLCTVIMTIFFYLHRTRCLVLGEFRKNHQLHSPRSSRCRILSFEETVAPKESEADFRSRRFHPRPLVVRAVVLVVSPAGDALAVITLVLLVVVISVRCTRKKYALASNIRPIIVGQTLGRYVSHLPSGVSAHTVHKQTHTAISIRRFLPGLHLHRYQNARFVVPSLPPSFPLHATCAEHSVIVRPVKL